MSILCHIIVDCTIYQWQTTMDLIRKYIARSEKQLLSFYQKALSNSDSPKILTKDKKLFLKTFDKVST
jgi:hypothetical protein